MSLHSVVGEGSTFSFSVPINEPLEVCKRFVKRLRTIRGSRKTRVFAIKATIDNHGDSVRVQETHIFLNYLLNSQDLLIPLASGKWLIVMSAESSEVKDFFDNAMKEVVRANRNRPQGPLPDVQLEFAAEFNLEDGPNTLKSLLSGESALPDQKPSVTYPIIRDAKGEALAH